MTPDRILVLSVNRPTWSWANWLTPSAMRGCGEIRDLEPAPGPFGSGRSGAWFAWGVASRCCRRPPSSCAGSQFGRPPSQAGSPLDDQASALARSSEFVPFLVTPSSVMVAPTMTSGLGREEAHATAGAVVTAETVAGVRRLWSITPTATFFCRRWRQRPQTRGGSERDRPLDDQAPALVSRGEVVPFLVTPSLDTERPTIAGAPATAAVGRRAAVASAPARCPMASQDGSRSPSATITAGPPSPENPAVPLPTMVWMSPAVIALPEKLPVWAATTSTRALTMPAISQVPRTVHRHAVRQGGLGLGRRAPAAGR